MSQDAPGPLVLLVEDEASVRLELSRTLTNDGLRVLPVASAEEAWNVLHAVPDVKAVITEVSLSAKGMTGLELARKVSAEKGIGVVVLSRETTLDPGELPYGVYFVAQPVHRATLAHLLRNVVAGHAPFHEPTSAATEPASKDAADLGLTPRQHDVLELLVQGKSNRDIAEALGLSENTIKVHLVAIYRILGVSSRTEALLTGMKALRQTQ